MTAPDRLAQTLIKILAKRGRPHMTMPQLQLSCCNDRLFQLRDLKFMLARDAFMDFTCTFDAILQFRAQWRQKLRDGKDSSPRQVCDYSPTEAYLLSN
jgi:hypothetical protein